MRNVQTSDQPRGGVPRGLSQTGLILFSYGFRPFFLGAGVWALGAMLAWIAALMGMVDIGGDYGAAHWHAHEMIFGFAPAVLAGFLLTAVPNWTGRLPVSGPPLAGLFGIWLAGRLVLLVPSLIETGFAAAIDSLFLPVLLAVCVREVIAGRKWKDLKVVIGLGALSLANICFHLAMLDGEHPAQAVRLGMATYVLLITVVGGRILPSFTRNWLNREGETRFPKSYGLFDTVAIASGLAALAAWVLLPQSIATTGFAGLAGCLHLVRLARWRGQLIMAEKLLLILHVAYAFVGLGFFGIAMASMELIDDVSALHVLTIGTVTTMMLAVMTRATRGHTGRALSASLSTKLSYLALIACALLRPAAGLLPDFAEYLYAASGAMWIAAFALFLTEYGPMLVMARRKL